MSLFDTIRYPVIDIFDTDELDRIPVLILKAWLKECIYIVDYGYAYLDQPSPDWGVVILHLIHGYFLSRKITEDDERERLQEGLKEAFTYLLRQHIKNYDGE